nr:MAG TPA: hypothetical protein [Caudoviricetes sp.]
MFLVFIYIIINKLLILVKETPTKTPIYIK